MGLDGLTFPLTRGQLDVWLAQQTRYAGTQCQLELFARAEGSVDPDLREHVNPQALQEDRTTWSRFFEVNVELAMYGLSRFKYSARAACQTALSILCTRMPVSDLLFEFASLQTQVNESFLLLDGGEHAYLDSGGNPAELPQPANAVRRLLSGRVQRTNPAATGCGND
jgi:glycopeptidolipid biosynthesis protein